ncbi:MAG: hypothetical protein J6B04_05630 [Clostridia bacterium]|nr:hypothetical protein [Clostridia bacterium]
MTAGKRLPPLEGENGRLYFNFNVGAKYVVYELGGTTVFEITNCYYRNGIEYYDITRDGVLNRTPFSGNRLSYLLKFKCLEQIEPGTPQELPLLIDEVKLYYAKKYDAYKTAKNAALAALKNTKYAEVEKAVKALYAPIAFAELQGDGIRANELRAQLNALEEKRLEILKKTKVDLSLFEERKYNCQRCRDFGTVDGIICDCVYSNVDDIKAFSAAQRIAERAKRSRN